MNSHGRCRPRRNPPGRLYAVHAFAVRGNDIDIRDKRLIVAAPENADCPGITLSGIDGKIENATAEILSHAAAG